jgi:hypothetical protein
VTEKSGETVTPPEHDVEHASGDNRPPAYYEGDKAIFRFSSAGNCLKALVASLMGYTPMPPPDKMQVKFDEGHEVEPVIIKRFSEEHIDGAKWKMLDPGDLASRRDLKYVVGEEHGQFLVEIPVGSKAVLRGHLDGIAQLYRRPLGYGHQLRDRAIVEVKGFSESTRRKYQSGGLAAFPYYETQLALQMAIGLPAAFVIGEKVYDEDGTFSHIGDVTWDWFTKPPISLGRIKARLLKAVRYAEAGELPPCDMPGMYPNSFYYLCDEDKAPKPAIPVVEDEQLAHLAGAYHAAAAAEKMAKGVKAEASLALRNYFDEKGAKGTAVECMGWEIQDIVIQQPAKTMKAFEMRYPKVTKCDKSDNSR